MKKFGFLILALLVSNAAFASSKAPVLLQARDLIYNAQFGSANKLISKHIGDNPKDPYGYLMRGIMNDWKQQLRSKTPSYDRRIFNDFNKARSLAQVAVDDDRNNIEKKITLAHALMYLSKKMIDMGNKFRAAGYLKRARDIMNYVKIHHPDNKDVYFPLGIFNYYSAKVPRNMKWLASMLGFSGSAQTGLQYLRKAAEYDNFNQVDAIYLMGHINIYDEKNFAVAEKYNARLRNRYPNNFEFRNIYARIAREAKKWPEALKRYQAFASYCEKAKCTKFYTFQAQYYIAESYLNLKQKKKMMPHIEAAIDANPKDYWSAFVKAHYWGAVISKEAGDKKKTCDYVKDIHKLQKYNMSIWQQTAKEFPECVPAEG